MSTCHTIFNQLYSEFQRNGQLSSAKTRPMTEEEIVERSTEAMDMFYVAGREDNHADDLDPRAGEVVYTEPSEVDLELPLVTSWRFQGDHRKGVLEMNDVCKFASFHQVIRADSQRLSGFSGMCSADQTFGHAYTIDRADLENSTITEWYFCAPPNQPPRASTKLATIC